MQAKYFRISALVLELRMLIFFRSEKIMVTESAIRLSGTAAVAGDSMALIFDHEAVMHS